MSERVDAKGQDMQVTIEAYTPNPVDVCSRFAGLCYGKQDSSRKRLQRCFKSGHLGIFEHASVSFLVEGISRACSHQLVRHRMASYNQVSQRYCKMGEEYRFVVPDSIKAAGMVQAYGLCTAACLETYQTMLEAGVPAEDARYVLPQGGTTSIVVTMNLRELFHFWDLRTDKHAQWEIRQVAGDMIQALRDLGDDPQYDEIVDLWAGYEIA